jgi:hypothetical protein
MAGSVPHRLAVQPRLLSQRAVPRQNLRRHPVVTGKPRPYLRPSPSRAPCRATLHGCRHYRALASRRFQSHPTTRAPSLGLPGAPRARSSSPSIAVHRRRLPLRPNTEHNWLRVSMHTFPRTYPAESAVGLAGIPAGRVAPPPRVALQGSKSF